MSKTVEDLHIDRNCIVSAIEENNVGVVEIRIQAYAVPTEQLEPDEYQSRVNFIRKKTKRLLGEYVSKNLNTYAPNKIIDFNFTSANLRKGYNKSVSISLFVKKRFELGVGRTKKMVKEGFKDYTYKIINLMKEEGFKCYKRKQVINSHQV